MDGIFGNEMSNVLQMYTFPLEVVGLTLAAIEVRFPERAKRLAGLLEDIYSHFAGLETKKWHRNKPRPMDANPFRYVLLLTRYYLSPHSWADVWIGVAFAVVFGAMIGLTIYSPNDALSLTWLSVQFWTTFISISFLFILVLFWSTHKLAKITLNFVEGRAVGTLGIIIAGLGVLGEAYQFTALMLV
jgi:hypothetical protein